jgi:hypothetical protein
MSKLSRKELEYVIEPQVRQFCGPLFFALSLETPFNNVIANGSFGLVDTGSKKLLVTCLHVWNEFQQQQLENPGLNLCICLDKKNPVVFAPKQPLGEDSELDIATFDMEPFLDACSGLQFYPLKQNPPRRVNVDDALFFIGFPGDMRFETENMLGVGRAPYAVRVSSVDGSRFHSDISPVLKRADQFGGISGCPCFLIRAGKPIQLVGFATALVFHRYLMFTHARCLNVDGTVTR